MIRKPLNSLHPWFQVVLRHRAWIMVALIIVVAFAIRVRLRAMPLERDEGEYAYAGQLILQGVPPYKLAYNMKLPGTYAAYASLMAVFGQSASGIHVGLGLVNGASIALMFLIGRRLMDETAGVTAAAVFALMSLSPSVLGLAAHATHFVVLPALGGTLLLLQAGAAPKMLRALRPRTPTMEGTAHPNPAIGLRGPTEKGLLSPARTSKGGAGEGSDSEGGQGEGRRDMAEGKWQRADGKWRRVEGRGHLSFDLRSLASGVLFGLAFLMKQHGIFFAVFAVIYLGWTCLTRKPRNWRAAAAELGVFTLGLAIPYAVMCLWLICTGAFSKFIFWTFTYASKYVSAIPMAEGPAYLRGPLGGVFDANPFFWILPGLALIVMWWEDRLKAHRLFLTLFVICSILAVSAGFYFREHYFILLLPALALLTGIAVSRSIHLLRHDKTIELFLAVPILLLFLIGLGAAFVGCGSTWFEFSSDESSEKVYGTTIFLASAKAADYLRNHTAKDARIAVLGSEPEIYFGARRRSATPYIYAYPLMEMHDYAAKMQDDLIHDIEIGRPDYVVFINDDLSWRVREHSERKIYQWWDAYWDRHYEVEQTINIAELNDAGQMVNGGKYLLVLKRKRGDGVANPKSE